MSDKTIDLTEEQMVEARRIAEWVLNTVRPAMRRQNLSYDAADDIAEAIARGVREAFRNAA